MMKLSVSIVFVSALAACKGGDSGPASGSAAVVSDGSAEINAFTDRLCACKTRTCARQINEEYEAWTAKQPKAGSATAATKVYAACMDKAETIPTNAEADDVGAIVAKNGAYKDQMCACKDKVCADAVSKELTAWAAQMATKMATNSHQPTEAQTKQMTDDAMAYADCMTKAMGAGGGSDVATMTDAIAKMGDFQSQMCKCKDKACANNVNDAFMAWTDDLTEKMKGIVPTAAQMKKMTDSSTEYARCMVDATGAK